MWGIYYEKKLKQFTSSPILFTPGGAKSPDTLPPFVSIIGYCICSAVHP